MFWTRPLGLTAWFGYYLVVTSVVLCTGQLPAAQHEWRRQDIPNPQTDPQACGRYKASYVCDPNHILSETEADYLDSLIYDIRHDTGGCHCPAKDRGHKLSCPVDPHYGGYHAAVVVLQKIQIVPDATDDEKLKVAEGYADYLRKFSWAYGMCDDDLVIIASQDDQVVYTKVGETTQQTLSSTCVDKIFNSHVDSFTIAPGGYGLGITRLLESYKSILTGQSSCTKSFTGLYIFIGLVLSVIVLIAALILLKYRGFLKCPQRGATSTGSGSAPRSSEARHTPGHRRHDGASFTFGTGRNVFEYE